MYTQVRLLPLAPTNATLAAPRAPTNATLAVPLTPTNTAIAVPLAPGTNTLDSRWHLEPTDRQAHRTSRRIAPTGGGLGAVL